MIGMKLLFICLAFVKKDWLRSPSWVRGIIPHLDADISVSFLSTGSFDLTGVEIPAIEGRHVGLFPRDRWDTPEKLAAVAKEEAADVIVIFGSETAHSRNSLTLCKKAGLLDKTAIFIQGMAYACAKHYAEGVPEKIIRRRTLRDRFKHSNIRDEQKRMEALAENERYVISTARHFIGRTAMDRSIVRMIHPDASYYKCNDIMRASFYEGGWQYENCEKHRIFVSQYYYPLKGFHYLLEAASMLISKYPDLTIAAAGYNPIQASGFQNEFKDSSYIRYIKSLIRKYGLQDHIELTGQLDEAQMKAQFLKANVFVMPSTIENSPNSLAEAMLLGTPCIAAFVGGIPDFADHRREAYLYPSTAAYQLARYLDEILQNPDEAARLGANAKKRAEQDYNIKKNAEALSSTFRAIAKKN